jgi:hypothetical protein
MTNKYILIAGAAVIVFAGTFSVLFHMKTNPQPLFQSKSFQSGPQACIDDVKVCPDGTYVGRSGPNCQFAECSTPAFVWTFNKDESGDVPMTSVSLQVSSGKKYLAGNYEGSCSEISNSSWPLLSGEKSGVICWWAGAGTELGIFEENNQLVVKKGILEEGDAETAGVRGNFQPLFKLGM